MDRLKPNSDLEKDCPEVTTVSTTGELEERPMSTYTGQEMIH